jgi:hypothetical protein
MYVYAPVLEAAAPSVHSLNMGLLESLSILV